MLRQSVAFGGNQKLLAGHHWVQIKSWDAKEGTVQDFSNHLFVSREKWTDALTYVRVKEGNQT